MASNMLRDAARLRDIDRRLAAIEHTLGLPSAHEYDARQLVRLYISASKRGESTPEGCTLWCAVLRHLRVEDLVVLAPLVHDPFPFRPFLVELDGYAKLGYAEARDTGEKVVGVAEDYLELQGFGGIVHVRDIAATCLPTNAAVRAISEHGKETSRRRRSKHSAAQGS